MYHFNCFAAAASAVAFGLDFLLVAVVAWALASCSELHTFPSSRRTLSTIHIDLVFVWRFLEPYPNQHVTQQTIACSLY